MADNSLTEMQEKFARGVAEGESPTQSAINAGYSKATVSVQASKLMKIVKIQKRIAELRQEMGIKIDTKKDTMLEMLYNIAEDSKNETQHRLKAMEMISKIEGYFKDQPVVEVNNNTFNPEKMSLEQLEAEMKKMDDELNRLN